MDALGAVTESKIDMNKSYENRTEIVLTRPKDPSKLDKIIRLDNELSVHIEDTEEAFLSMAAEANERIVVMTPFFRRNGG